MAIGHFCLFTAHFLAFILVLVAGSILIQKQNFLITMSAIMHTIASDGEAGPADARAADENNESLQNVHALATCFGVVGAISLLIAVLIAIHLYLFCVLILGRESAVVEKMPLMPQTLEQMQKELLEIRSSQGGAGGRTSYAGEMEGEDDEGEEEEEEEE